MTGFHRSIFYRRLERDQIKLNEALDIIRSIAPNVLAMPEEEGEFIGVQISLQKWLDRARKKQMEIEKELEEALNEKKPGS